MTVKRYTPTQCCEHDGTYVTYSDYQKLVAENAAMNSTMKDIAIWSIPEDVCNEMNKLGLEVRFGMPDRDYFRLKADKCMKSTPATDAAIAEIKAQGVALAIGHLSKKFTNLGVPITSLEWLEVELRAGRKG